LLVMVGFSCRGGGGGGGGGGVGGAAGRARLRAGGDWPGGLGFNIHPTSGMEACSHVSNLARALFVLGRDKSIKRMVDDTRRSRVTGGTS